MKRNWVVFHDPSMGELAGRVDGPAALTSSRPRARLLKPNSGGRSRSRPRWHRGPAPTSLQRMPSTWRRNSERSYRRPDEECWAVLRPWLPDLAPASPRRSRFLAQTSHTPLVDSPSNTRRSIPRKLSYGWDSTAVSSSYLCGGGAWDEGNSDMSVGAKPTQFPSQHCITTLTGQVMKLAMIASAARLRKYLAKDHNMSAFGNHDWSAVMTRRDLEIDLELLSADELWDLHEKLTKTLKAKLKAQQKVLEQRLAQIDAGPRIK